MRARGHRRIEPGTTFGGAIHVKNGWSLATVNASASSVRPACSAPSTADTSFEAANMGQAAQPPGWSLRRNVVSRVGRTRLRRSRRTKPRTCANPSNRATSP